MSVVIAIDAGTTGVRSFALRPDGSPAGYAYREFPAERALRDRGRR